MQWLLFVGSLCWLLSAAPVWAQANVENPPVNSTQSGISLISGWVCTATKIEAMIDNLAAVQIPYGTPRGDAQSTCGGKVNTGFGALINWNILGDGSHVVKILADGQPIASIPITVVTFGVSFLQGASRTLTTGFGGCLAALQWRESQQNFVIAGTELCFQPFLGRWEFVTKKSSGNEVNHYALETIELRTNVSTGEQIEVVRGTDLDHGGLVLLIRVKDLVITPQPYDFTVASLLSSRCEILVFKQIGPGSVQGIGTSFPADPVSGCQRYPSPPPPEYPLTGTQTAAALSMLEGREFVPPTPLEEQALDPSVTNEGLAEILEQSLQLMPSQQP